jgi:hypothetical protein
MDEIRFLTPLPMYGDLQNAQNRTKKFPGLRL